MKSKNINTRRNFIKAAVTTGAISLAGCSDISSFSSSGQAISMGTLLPVTGSLSQYGSGQQKGANIAVEDINSAGGPLGREIDVTNMDSEGQVDVATQKYQTLVESENVIGYVGAARSGISATLATDAPENEVMQMSHWSSTPRITELGWNEDNSLKYVGRVWPPDTLQGLSMAKTLAEDSYIGADSVSIIHLSDAYGKGTATVIEQALSNVYDMEISARVGYSQETSDYTSTINEATQDDPDGLALIGHPENTKTIVSQWANGNYGGTWVFDQVLAVEDFRTGDFEEITAGHYFMQSVDTETEGASIFRDKIGDDFVSVADGAYDAMFLQALAIEKAGEATGTAIAENIRSVSNPEGETVTVGEFEKAKEILDNGEEINYQGALNKCNLNENLEVIVPFKISQQQGGEFSGVDEVPVSFFNDHIGQIEVRE